tara:strand:+ start:514 stop:768 length:255 start_codon:yes stop_codon:yes gene_type:complete
MSDAEKKLILITDFIEQKLRKESELEFYLEELGKLEKKIGYLRSEVSLTNTIISMIKGEKVYDIKDTMLTNSKSLLLKTDKDDK